MSTQQQTERTFWRAYVRAREALFEQQAMMYSRSSSDDSREPSMDGVQRQLDLARQATGIRTDQPSSGRKLLSPRPRASIEGAFVHLHTADIMLTQLLPPEEIDARTPYVLARLRECLSPRDQRVRTAEAELLHCDVASHRRAALANAMRTVYTIADQQHARVRSFKNALIVGTIVLALVVVGVVTVGYSAPSAIPLCFNPTLTTATQQPPQSTTGQQQACPAGKGHPAPGDVGLVALLGLLGGALSAAVAVRKLSGTSTPYAVPITLSVLKLPFGALTAVAGLLLLHGQFVPGLSELDSQGQILAYAVVLGVAQQVATQFVDRRAHEVLSMQPTPQGHGEQPPSPESSINRHHAYDHGAASPDGEDRP